MVSDISTYWKTTPAQSLPPSVILRIIAFETQLTYYNVSH